MSKKIRSNQKVRTTGEELKKLRDIWKIVRLETRHLLRGSRPLNYFLIKLGSCVGLGQDNQNKKGGGETKNEKGEKTNEKQQKKKGP